MIMITRQINEKRRAMIDALELDGSLDDHCIKILYLLAERCDDENRCWEGARDSATAKLSRDRFHMAEETFDAAIHAVYEGEIR